MDSTDFVSTGRTAIALANGDFSASLESKQDPRMAQKRQKGSKRAVLVKLLLKQKSLKTICKSASRDWQILLTNTKQCLCLAGNPHAAASLEALLAMAILTSTQNFDSCAAVVYRAGTPFLHNKVNFESFKMRYRRHMYLLPLVSSLLRQNRY